MKRLSSRELRQLLDTVRDLYILRDRDSFAVEAVNALTRLIPSDATVFGEIDPPRRRFRFVSDFQGPRFPEQDDVYRRYLHQHPFVRHYMGGGAGSAVTIFDVMPRRQFHRLDLYNEYFRRLRLEAEMVAWLPARRPLNVTFAVHRDFGDFTERDRLMMNLLRPHLIQAYENAEAVTRSSERQAAVDQTFAVNRQALLVVGPNGHIKYADGHAREWITRFVGRFNGRRLPDRLERELRRRDADWKRTVSDAPPALGPLILDTDDERLTIRVLRQPTDRVLLLGLQPLARDMRPLERLGLTAREAEVLGWVADGKANEAIGRILGISSRTVEKHMESVFRKLGVESRTAATARALAVMDPVTYPPESVSR